MFSRYAAIPRSSKDEGEKPFWISFADLMSALMVLFLVSLTVALNEANKQRDEAVRVQEELKQEREELARAKAELEEEKRKRNNAAKRRSSEIKTVLDSLSAMVSRHDGIRFNHERHIIDFGSRAQYGLGRHDLTHLQANALRKFAPDLLAVVRSELGQKWLKRIVVEGFTSSDWTYLDNLNLSLQRSQRVMCVLLAESWAQATQITDKNSSTAQPIEHLSKDDQALIKQLFLIGGYSSNSTRSTPEESRRIELRIEFFQLDELDANGAPLRMLVQDGPTGNCAL